MNRTVLAAGIVFAALLISTAPRAQDDTDILPPPPSGGLFQGGPGTGQPLSFSSGAMLIHGNYCGVGNNGMGVPPIDALDAACMEHDACTPDGGLPSCGCNARFATAVRRVEQNPRQPEDLRNLAGLVKAVIPLIACHS